MSSVQCYSVHQLTRRYRLIQALYGSDGNDDEYANDMSQLTQEVLLSYRLLFAQSRNSRRLLRQALHDLRTIGEHYDSFLDTMCLRSQARKIRALPSTLWPVTCRYADGSLLEKSSYSSQDDFPLFGQRLTKLQDFSLRQQPSRLRDLWHDRRNPLQWYTFWAVLVVGGLSLVLAVLQLIVGILQVVYSARLN